MLTKQTSPKSKIELMTALRQTQVDKVTVMDEVATTDTTNIKRDLEAFLRSAGTKPVSVVFLKGRK